MIRALIALIFLWVSAPGHAAADLDTSHLQSLANTHYHRWDSETLERPLHVYVRVPPGATMEQRLPTVYLLDGGASFPLLSGHYHYLRYTDEVPPVILVGIAYGSDTFEGGNYRGSDFTAPAADRDYWGGAARFQQALRQELLPMIEGLYPAAPERRVLWGQSIGGQFVLFTALTQPQLFQGLIASNPALHRNLDYFLQWRGGDLPGDSTRLFVSVGELDDARFRVPAMQWIEHWSQPARLAPFVLEVRHLPGQTHVSAGAESFRQGLLWLVESGLID
jgi:predicted alpha/beta superfamily hydrolase